MNEYLAHDAREADLGGLLYFDIRVFGVSSSTYLYVHVHVRQAQMKSDGAGDGQTVMSFRENRLSNSRRPATSKACRTLS